jgi:mono/diheme cytochrome c family protein
MTTLLAVLLIAQARLPSPAPLQRQKVDPPELTFTRRCITCHGEDGRGKTSHGVTMHAPDFTSDAWQNSITDEGIIEAIWNGRRGTSMAAWGRRLSPAEIASLVPYLRAFGRTQDQASGR